MKKTLLGGLVLLVMATIFIAVTAGYTDTKAQGFGGHEEGTYEEVDCPPDMCFSGPTLPMVEDTSPESRGTCSCGIFYDPDCHYEYISAFNCIPINHYHDDDPEPSEFICDYSGDEMGIKRYAETSVKLELFCPIPTDAGAGSIKGYSIVDVVWTYIYHDSSGTNTTVTIYSADSSGNVTNHGDASNSSSGHQTLTVTPSGTKRPNWFAHVELADNDANNALHNIIVCYDPD